MATKNWEPCPRCKSTRVESRGVLFFALMGICMAGCGLWLLLIPFIGIPMIAVGALLFLVSPFLHGMLQCKDCKHSWRVTKKTPVKN